ncbi:MAG: carboxy terminal-processing peptidase [Bacteroidales bacterium]|nr:carboxy terminal-processing peptidase [Bacteroidales bacterium]
MKKNLLIISAILISSTFLFACFFNETDKEKVVMSLTYNLIKSNHYETVVFDDELSFKIFDKYLENLDYTKRYLLQSDVKKLTKNNDKIDDQIRKEELTFFDLSYEMISKRQMEVKEYPAKILANPFDYSVDEDLSLDYDNIDYPKNDTERFENWRKILKLEVIQEIDNQLTKQDNAKEKADTNFEFKDYEQIEKEARETVLKNYDDYFDRVSKLRKEDYFSIFINAITLSIDPHSEYYAPKSKEDFDIQMSGELEGIGATLTQKFGEIKVANVVIGGAAWKEGELEEGDIIFKVAQEGEEAVNVSNMRLDDAVRLIRGKKGTIVILTVKKIDGTIKEISITRDKIILEETYVRSLIITDENTNSKVGYIHLPSFYIDFQKYNGRRCSKDFKDELLKLKKENVEGIIIDLRDNGGGSLSEVVDIAGFFIDKGPIVQVRNRNGRSNQLNDDDASIIFDGNVVVMTNQFSASASEIFAAAMQDYNRAIIFGTPQTLGKGTVQQIMDLDKANRVSPDLKPLGALKLTIQKFYRINGGSTQIEGVKSDISYTTTYTYLEINEESFDNALQWDEIPALSYDKWVPKYNLSQVKESSSQRMKNDTAFIFTENYAMFLKQEDDQENISLNLDNYRERTKIRRDKRKEYNKATNKQIPVVFEYLKDDVKEMESDTLVKYRYDNWSKKLKKDFELNEAYNIVLDMNKF